MSIRTILFDLDGTLIDTNELILASFGHTFDKYGYSYSREEILDFMGPPLLESFEQIASGDRINEMVATYREHNLAVHDDYVSAFPQVVETVKALQEKGIKMGIVTTKMRGTVEMGLKLTGLEEFFETVITLDDVKHAKPHPEPVILAMEKLKADAATTLMVGDNHHDIEAGHNAGTKTAGVAWSLKGKERLQKFKPTYMLEEMTDILDILEG